MTNSSLWITSLVRRYGIGDNMHGTGIFHPQFKYHPRPSIETAMMDRIEIYEPTGKPAQWTPGVGMNDDSWRIVYRGRARLQPDQDWKARDRNFANEHTATLGVRIGIPVQGNELDPADPIAPFIGKGYKVVVIDPSPESKDWIEGTDLIVRNPLQATQKWLRTFVADTGTRQVNG